MNASKGTEEYRVGEIFLSSTPATADADRRQCQQDPRAAEERRLVRRLCPPIFGSLDRRGRRRSRLGPPRAASRRRLRPCFASMGPGTISDPIPVPGGVSIIAVQDTRKILTADPRDAVLSLKQVSIIFPKGTTAQQAEPMVVPLRRGGAQRRRLRRRRQARRRFPRRDRAERPGQAARPAARRCSNMMLPMQVGQATRPSASLEDGVRVLVICGRDEVDPEPAELRRGLQPAQRGARQHCAPAATCATFAATR